MQPTVYALHIGTLATWLTVAGFGIVGTVIPDVWENPTTAKKPIPYQELKPIVMTEGFSDAPLPPVQEMDTTVSSETVAEADPLPTPPAMPEIAAPAALPEIPNLPAAIAKPAATQAPAAAQPRPSQPSPARPARPASAPAKPAAAGKPGGGGNGTSTLSDAQRLASGYKPRPSYPSSARSRSHTGTVVVEFVIEENGRVLSASVQKSSGWPELDQSAVANMRRWKFAPGKRDKRTIPITFKLK